MKRLIELIIVFMLSVAISAPVYAQHKYLMTGAAQYEKSSEAHVLPFPVNPVTSMVLTFDGNVFSFHYAGDRCSVQIERRMKFYFDPVLARAFRSSDDFARFILDKFHQNYKSLRETYLLGESNVPLCSGLREAMIYGSDDTFLIIVGSWFYVFQRQSHDFVNAENNFDCDKARTSVEHIICGNDDLIKLDAAVNRGFVAMQLVNSREISYRDPVRMDQINWVRSVRDRCTSAACLLNAYRSRILFIKGKISSAYPSYPDKEPDQEGD